VTGWAGDQVVHYIPAIDCFVLYVQSFTGSGTQANRNIVKIAIASQADLKKFSGGKQAWSRQWDFTPDTFGLGTSWMDFPDLSYGKDFLHVNTNVFVGKNGKLFYELPLGDMVAGRGLSFLFGFIDDAKTVTGSPAQNGASGGSTRISGRNSSRSPGSKRHMPMTCQNWPPTSPSVL